MLNLTILSADAVTEFLQLLLQVSPPPDFDSNANVSVDHNATSLVNENSIQNTDIYDEVRL